MKEKEKQSLRLYYDGEGTEKHISASFGLVSYYLKKILTNQYSIKDCLIDLSDKSSHIFIPSSKNELKPILFFFEELFVRALETKTFYDAKKIAFFNLAFFRGKTQSFKKADLLLFNSRYLMECYLSEAFDYSKDIPPCAVLPLPIAYEAFPNGYPNKAGTLNLNLLKRLKRDYYVTHGMRPGKQNIPLTLHILDKLNHVSSQRKDKPFIFIFSEHDQKKYVACAKELGLLERLEPFLFPMFHLSHKHLTHLFKHSHLGLCFDTVLEAFGYYPVESVYQGCPVFTNGQANLRHLLPKNHGIYTIEPPDIYFGDNKAFARGIQKIAQFIYTKLQNKASVRAQCEKGKQYIKQHYSKKTMFRSFNTSLSQFKVPALKSEHYQISPYVRWYDWQRKIFITDFKQFKAPTSFFKKVTQVQTRKSNHLYTFHTAPAKTDHLVCKDFIY